MPNHRRKKNQPVAWRSGSQWYYEQWTTYVAHAGPKEDLFVNAQLDRDIDDRVHLCGGTKRRTAKQQTN
jgi:hypothetical protein